MCVKAILLWAAAGQFIKSEEAINNASTCVVFVCVHSFWLGYWVALCQSLRSHREMAQSFSPTASSAPTSPITNPMWPQGRYSARVVQHLKQHSTSNSYQLLLNWIFAIEQNTVHSAVCVPHTVKRGDLSSSQPSTGCTWTTLLCELCSGSCKQVKLFIAWWFWVTWPHQPLTALWPFHRILTCYNDTKQSVKLAAAPSCLQEVNQIDPSNITKYV